MGRTKLPIIRSISLSTVRQKGLLFHGEKKTRLKGLEARE